VFGETPPRPPRRPKVLSLHGDDRTDDWYWMRDRDDPAVVAHLQAENAHTEVVLAPTVPLREKIYAEITSHIQETDASAPVPHGPWEYYTRTVEGLQYAIHCRRRRGGGDETILLDENVEASGHEYFSLGGFAITPDHQMLSYAVDTTGGERHTLRFRDLASGTDLDDVVDDVTYGLAWADDNRTCFYVRPDDAMRPYQVWRHALGAAADDDVLVFEESDERFFVHIDRSRSGRFVLIETASKTSSETWFVPTGEPTRMPRVVESRTADHEYSVEHHIAAATGDRFLIVTNTNGSRNFKLVAAPVDAPGRANWVELVAHRDDVRLEDVDAFTEYIVLSERSDGLDRVRVMSVADGTIREVEFPDPVFTSWVGANLEYETTTLRIGYTSLVAPATDIDLDMHSLTRVVVKTQPVPGYDAAQYVSARLWATAPDGTRVPISLVHRRDTPVDGSAPALLYGYGAYEHSVDPTFRASRLALVDRGFVFAIAHVRGGGELGREWYENGRLDHKENTFTDFIAAAEHLQSTGYVAEGRLVARGGSAGGLLMGAIANLRPDLFVAIVAEVPFVDVVTTMLDPSLPLTITEWEEWGDPRDPEAYARMKRYSPYDNVRPQAYPAMLVTTGLNDPRVQFWEPAKWVAKLRANTTGSAPVLLRTELGAGHGGPSGRYDAWHEEALVLAFVCHAVGLDAT
jgi:oligopeptidase B